MAALTNETGRRQFVSVVIPALNEERRIGACLDSLRALDWPEGDFEVIVVDNGSRDRTVEIARSYRAYFALYVLVRPAATIASLRNAGVQSSRGSIYAFLDADCTVGPRWMRAGANCLREPSIGIAGCSHALPVGSSWVATAWHAGIERKRARGERAFLPSGNMFVSATAFKAVGGFDESLKTNEDYDLCLRCRQKGYRVFSDPAIFAVHHGIPQTTREFFDQQRWHGTHVMKVFLRNLTGPLRFGELASFKAVYYAVCSILLHAWLIVAAVTSLLRPVSLALVLTPLVGLALAAVLMAVRTVRGSETSLLRTLQLAYLYYLYGVARASSTLLLRACA